MRFQTWMSVVLSAACSCGAEPASDPAGAEEPEETACFVLDGATYRTAAEICAEQSPGSVAAACVGAPPPAEQCDAFRVLYRRQAEEHYFCCCDPATSSACDFALP